ncbi:hypothetical protein CERZMDRAFT_90193 [Cercospora zeae-maydis SCOH1-5]|uniref:Ribosomal protein S8 n=1 Tax=Cercospora zeae-maydis SCOH1-5 TaxID=717836 RepID=A0A6A6FMP3_9PEZI|nr:hypothetical protein CERZMDRAFT_90193 [Cercospora zeae-maydis SCOH1-5]
MRTAEELERRGWRQQIPRFIGDVRAQIDALTEEREDQYALQQKKQGDELDSFNSAGDASRELRRLEQTFGATPEQRREFAARDVLAGRPAQQQALFQRLSGVPLRELESMQFDLETLSSIAGKNAYMTEREIRLNGITIEAMGMPISNQTVTLPVEEYQDPSHMETEGLVTQENRASRRLWLGLKYYESKPVITKAQMVSKPTKRMWLDTRALGKIVRGQQAGEVKPLTRVGEIMAISTDRGIMEARECVERKIGGQPLCRVW